MSTPPLRVFAAGSLKGAFAPLCRQFGESRELAVEVTFGPAGLLRERIEAGEPCDLFASANVAHPQQLIRSGRALEATTFAFNRLNLTARSTPQIRRGGWLDLLRDPSLRIATSTPGCDPSGDYALALFARIEQRHPGMGKAIAGRALALVGGRDTRPVPVGEIAGAWLLDQNRADVFIGYAHYARQLESSGRFYTLAIPEDYASHCEYQLARLSASPESAALAAWILSAPGQGFLLQAGLLAPEPK